MCSLTVMNEALTDFANADVRSNLRYRKKVYVLITRLPVWESQLENG